MKTACKVPKLPSVTVTSATLTPGPSSSVMVPKAVASPRVAFTGLDRVTRNSSGSSPSESFTIAMGGRLAREAPAGMVSTPESAA